MILKSCYIIFLSSILFSSNIKDNNKYITYETSECKIPIPKKYKLIRKSNKDEYLFNYTYIYNDFIDLRSITTLISDKNNLKKLREEINKKKIKLLSEKYINDFLIMNVLINDMNIYTIFTKKLTVIIANESQEFIDYFVNYCRLNSKKKKKGTSYLHDIIKPKKGTKKGT